MLYMCKCLFLIVATASLLGLSCGRLTGQEYDIDKSSPNGMYRVKVEVRAEEAKGTRDRTEHGKIQFFKGQNMIHAYEWENSDQYEPSFRETKPAIEWIDDSVLRMGEDRSDQPFFDELIVSNNTNEYLKYLSVSYGKNELFWVFDLAPESQIMLHASPRFKPDGSSNWFLGYGGRTQSEKQFEGSIDGRERKSLADGPLKFQITINAKDLR